MNHMTTLTDPLKDALNLAQRFQQATLFRQYVVERLWLVAPAALLMLATGLALAFGIVVYVGGTRPLTVLLSLLIAPFVLVGSLFVQAYLFLSWLEARALAKSLGRRSRKARARAVAWVERHLEADLGSLPPVPWLLAGIFLAPLAFARLDR